MSRTRLILLSVWVGLFAGCSIAAVLGFTGRSNSSIMTPATPGTHVFVEHGRVGLRTFSVQMPLSQMSSQDLHWLGNRTYSGVPTIRTGEAIQLGTPGSSIFYNGHGCAVRWPAAMAWTIDEMSLSYTFFWWLSLPSLLAVAYQLFLVRRRRRLATAGLCRHCGYDLRATPDRCPECGTAAPAKPV